MSATKAPRPKRPTVFFDNQNWSAERFLNDQSFVVIHAIYVSVANSLSDDSYNGISLKLCGRSDERGNFWPGAEFRYQGRLLADVYIADAERMLWEKKPGKNSKLVGIKVIGFASYKQLLTNILAERAKKLRQRYEGKSY